MNLIIEPIGVIKRTNAGLTDVLIYSDFEHILRNIVQKLKKGTYLLIVHKNKRAFDFHQVQVSYSELINRKGNLLRVRGLEADNDSVIDVRLAEILLS